MRMSKSFHSSQADLDKKGEHLLAKAKSFLKERFMSDNKKHDSLQKPRIFMRHRDSLDLIMNKTNEGGHGVSSTWTIGVNKLHQGQVPGIIMMHRDSLDLALKPPKDSHRRVRRFPAAA